MATRHAIRYILNLAAGLAFATLIGISHAQSAATQYLCIALNDLCMQIQGLIPVAAMLLVVAAAVIYSIGQIFGAETRARASVWATSCLTGAVIGVLIATIAPAVLTALANQQVTCSATPQC